MSISAAVQALASILREHAATHRDGKDPLFAALAAIARISYWSDRDDLAAWDEEWRRAPVDWDAFESSNDTEYSLANDIFSLGMHNMYGAIQSTETEAVYIRVAGRMVAAGIRGTVPLSSQFDFTRW